MERLSRPRKVELVLTPIFSPVKVPYRVENTHINELGAAYDRNKGRVRRSTILSASGANTPARATLATFTRMHRSIATNRLGIRADTLDPIALVTGANHCHSWSGNCHSEIKTK